MGKGNVYTEGYAFGCDKAIAIFSFFRVCVYVCTAKSFQYKLLYFQEFPWRPFFYKQSALNCSTAESGASQMRLMRHSGILESVIFALHPAITICIKFVKNTL